MKLSMWNIFYALSEREKMSLIKEGKQTILSARWIVSSKLNSDMVYVGRESEYFDVSDENVLIVHRHDMIIVYNADPAEIFNEICSIIDRFAQWETELQKCLKLEDGLTKMLDCSREFLKNPSYIYAPDGRSLAIASDFPKSIHWHWAEIIENGGLTDERMENLQETISLTDVFQDRFPTIRDSAMGNHQYMHVSIIVNGYMAGHFVMFSFLQPFYEGDIHIVDNLAVYLGKYMETHFADYSPTTKMGRIVTALIFHKEYEKKELQRLLDMLCWKWKDEYRFFVMKENVEKEPVLLTKAYIRVSKILTDAVVFLLDNQLVILERQSSDADKVINRKHIIEMMSGKFVCGVSNIFEGLDQCDKYFTQAQKETDYCIENGWYVSKAEEHGREYFESLIRKDFLGEAYIDRDIIKLKQYDQKNNTFYYETFRTWFYCGFHLATTARKLKIHRNSLTYRLDKIRELELIDLQRFEKLIDSRDIQKLNMLYFTFLYLDVKS